MFTKRNRLVAILVCMAIIVATLFSALLISIETHHDCSGHDCSICATIQRAEETIRNIGITLLRVNSFIVVPVLFLIILLLVCKTTIPVETLVSQKVRLDN